MGAEQSEQSEGFGEAPGGSFRGLVKDAVRYWEVRRVIYNAALVAVCAVWALVANVCYSAAYLVDIPMQQSSLANVWRKRRWGLWAVGTVIAIVLAN
jgi:hypothetical protein